MAQTIPKALRSKYIADAKKLFPTNKTQQTAYVIGASKEYLRYRESVYFILRDCRKIRNKVLQIVNNGEAVLDLLGDL